MSPEKQLRVQALAAWWHSRTNEYALFWHLERLESLDIPIDQLIEYLEEIRASEGVDGLGYFTSPYGMGKLRELEGSLRQGSTEPRPGGSQRLGDLLPPYAG